MKKKSKKIAVSLILAMSMNLLLGISNVMAEEMENTMTPMYGEVWKAADADTASDEILYKLGGANIATSDKTNTTQKNNNFLGKCRVYTSTPGVALGAKFTVARDGLYRIQLGNMYDLAPCSVSVNGSAPAAKSNFDPTATLKERWDDIGTYKLAAGEATILLTDFTSGNLRLDTIKLIPIVPGQEYTVSAVSSDPNYAQNGSGWKLTSSDSYPVSDTNPAKHVYTSTQGDYAVFSLPSDAPTGNYTISYYVTHTTSFGSFTIDGKDAVFEAPAATGWVSIGGTNSYWLTAGTSSVKLTCDTSTTRATSVRFTYIGDEAPLEKYSVTINNAAGTVTGAGGYVYGEKATVTALGDENYTFDYWQEGERIVSDEGEYTFVVSGDRELTAQFKPVNAETYDVVFKDINGVVLATMPVAAGGTLNETDITAVTQPSKPGKIFDGWDKSFPLAVNGKTIVTAKYRADETSEKYTVIANGETIADQVPFDTKVTVTASAEKEGESFSYWKDGNEKIVSYKSEYSFYVSGNISLTAVYGDSTTVVVPVVKTDNVMIDKTNSKMSFVSQISLPEGYELIECGTLISKTEGEITTETAGVTKVKARTQTAAGQYMASLTNVTSGAVRYARGYLIYKGPDGSITTIYGNTVSGTME